MHKVEKKVGSFVTQTPKTSYAKWVLMAIWLKECSYVFHSTDWTILLLYGIPNYELLYGFSDLIQYRFLRARTVSLIFYFYSQYLGYCLVLVIWSHNNAAK